MNQHADYGIGMELQEELVNIARNNLKGLPVRVLFRDITKMRKKELRVQDEVRQVFHYIYDGGVYPEDLAQSIGDKIKSLDFKHTSHVVCVVVPISSFTNLPIYSSALETKGLALRESIDISEQTDKEYRRYKNHTMRAHIFA